PRIDIGLQHGHLLKRIQSPWVVRQMRIGSSQCVLVHPVVRVELYCFLKSRDRLGIVAALEVYLAYSSIKFVRVGSKRESAVQLGYGLRIFPGGGIHTAESGMDFRQLVIQL